MRRVEQRVTVREVELLVVDVVQEHVDAREVERGEVDLLAEESPHVLLAKHLRELEQQRAGAARRIVHLRHLGLAHHGDAREQLAHFLRRVVLAARLARTRRVHLHEVLVRVAERVDGVVLEAAQVEVADRVEQLHELLVALGHGGSELCAVHVEVVEEPLEVVLALGAHGRALDVAEHPLERLVEVLVG